MTVLKIVTDLLLLLLVLLYDSFTTMTDLLPLLLVPWMFSIHDRSTTLHDRITTL